MGHAQILEKEFEANLCDALADRGWIYGEEARDSGWDRQLALHPKDVLRWLSTRYPEEYAKAVPLNEGEGAIKAAQNRLLKHLSEQVVGKVQIDRKTGEPKGGLLGVLRQGFRFAQMGRPTAAFGPMVAFPPANPLLTSAVEATKENRLRVMRQVRFDIGSNESIDLVLLVNGIPVATMELKTDSTQTVDDAKIQYKEDRVPTKDRPLLAPGRCLVHFAVSNTEVYMTTELKGPDAFFLPFNRGNNGHAGNPPSETGSPTDYLWRTILERGMLLRILQSYALWEPNRDKKPKKGEPAGRLVFPRFHQLRAVEKVTTDVDQRGAGGRYLIYHSAGSGKTKTISWMAHRLVRHINASGAKTFDSVIVITDRTVLDENVREGIGLLQSSEGLVVPVDRKQGSKSPQLRQALKEGGHIITCTLQTFGFVKDVLESDEDFSGRSWCVIADEAHSSQAGSHSNALRQLLTAPVAQESTKEHDASADGSAVTASEQSGQDEDGEGLSTDDLLAAADSAMAQAKNLTFIALTATPKAKTLRLFGKEVDDGIGPKRFEGFDTYTMAQAIEEEFILDVLQRYTPYSMIAKVKDELDRDDLVDKEAARTDIMRFARLHPTSIAQKVVIVVEHFRRNVMHELGGKARAMVVTSSRAAAVHWSKEMNKYIDGRGYGASMKTLVAFSGTVDLGDGDPLTEPGMNKLTDTTGAFRSDDTYKVLIVAEKFQTGFDEPRLCAMYVDKPLSGIATVQTLSRLNRTHPGKPAPIVLDFVNKAEYVLEDFRAYYDDAYIEGDFDANALLNLADDLDYSGFYTDEELEAVSEAYLTGASGEKLQHLWSPIRNRWKGKVHQAQTNPDKTQGAEQLAEALDFKAMLTKYAKLWAFLSQIVDFQDPTLHRRAILADALARNLHADGKTHEDYTSGMRLVSVEVKPKGNVENLGLTKGAEEPMEVPGFGHQSVTPGSETFEVFNKVVAEANDLLAKAGIETSGNVQAGLLRAVWGEAALSDIVRRLAEHNEPAQLMKSPQFRDEVSRILIEYSMSSQELAELLMGDGAVFDQFTGLIAQIAVAAKHDEKRGQ